MPAWITLSGMRLFGLKEIAQHLGVSRQRVSELRQISPGFPPPVAELACGPIFDASAVRAWARKRNTKVGRPSRTRKLGGRPVSPPESPVSEHNRAPSRPPSPGEVTAAANAVSGVGPPELPGEWSDLRFDRLHDQLGPDSYL